ncbi:hypothetical protein CYMTET_46447 [Cymbomonas tetramitiformis]|uniref:PiggyBac transposable element-derived protein domain-containing protein n=1 Tax=Cymbomonas tetramitiformis TaxID=36881 RepID=A0AAE0EXK8_9CHLO|nr:hypothetical protein CYMTET_46447 [Cymbomonas tetramitiformis]
MNSNMYAVTQGVGTDKYHNFKPFSAADMDLVVGLHVRNGLAPVPDMRYNFTKPTTSFVFGDSRVIQAIPGGYPRFKEMKAFFHLQDPRAPQPEGKPFWKVEPLLEVLRVNSEELLDLGPDVSLDEQDCGFQGRSALKDKIKFKAEGDGFLADCICQDGYTWTFHFRHDPTPLPLTQKDASDLHNSVHSKVSFIEKFRKVWDPTNKSKKVIKYTRLNVIDDYNFNMNGVASVNAYLLYKKQCGKFNIPTKKILNHLQFNVLLAHELCSGKRAAQFGVNTMEKKRGRAPFSSGPVPDTIDEYLECR